MRPAGANELAKRRMTSRLWSRRAAAHDASQRCLSAFGGKECTAMSPQWQTTASSMKRRAPGGTDTHEYCNVCDARTPFLRQCPSASVALIDKCYDGATNHSAGFATLGLYVVADGTTSLRPGAARGADSKVKSQIASKKQHKYTAPTGTARRDDSTRQRCARP